jgi:hypothetical protein
MRTYTTAIILMMFLVSCQNKKESNSGWITWQKDYQAIKVDSNNIVIKDVDNMGNIRSISILNINTNEGIQLIYLNGAVKYMGQSGRKPNKFIDIDSLSGDSAKLIVF